jgi:uncharacterized membrane protein
MKNNNYNKIFLSLAMLLVLSVSFVSAFSVSAPYMENKELDLSLNSKVTDLEFVLQNGGGATEDATIKVSVLEGLNIVSIVSENATYLVSPGAKVPVTLRITLPEEVQAGDSYEVVLNFATVTSTGSGEFGFGTGQEQRFTVIVNEEIQQEKEGISKTLLYTLIAVLFLLIIIVLVLIKRKKK